MIEPTGAANQIDVPQVKKRDPELVSLANSLEATFLAEMLKSAGLGKAREAFGGGAGEDHFSSLLVQYQADLLAKTQGIGLAEAIYRSLSSAETS